MNKTMALTVGLSIVVSSLLASSVADIKFDPIIKEVVSGKRVVVKANIKDKAGIDIARTYFKSIDGANYSFVPMSCKSTACSGILPAPSASTKSIDYLVLVKNANNVVYKTQTFNAKVLSKDSKTPAYQMDPSDEVIHVKTELARAPEMVEGFRDNIVIDVVEDSARYGVVAGLMQGSSTTTAVSAGTIAATGAGISTTTMVVGGAVALAAGGAAAASGGGSSSGSSSGETISSTTPYTSLVGDWSVAYTHTDGRSTVYDETLNENNTGTYTDVNKGENGSITHWNLENGYFTLQFDAGAVYSGQANGSTNYFCASSENGWTGCYTRK